MKLQTFLLNLLLIALAIVGFSILMGGQDRSQAIWIRIAMSTGAGLCIAPAWLLVTDRSRRLRSKTAFAILKDIADRETTSYLLFAVLLFGILMGLRLELASSAAASVLAGCASGGLMLAVLLINRKRAGVRS